MLTGRAWWFLLLSFLALLVGLGWGSASLALVGLAGLLWVGGEWLLFAIRIPAVVRRLRVRREVRDDRGPVHTLWAGRTFEVHVRLEADGPLGLPYAIAADRPPFGVEHVSGGVLAEGPVGRGQVLEMTYGVRCAAAGLARFEGVRVHVADAYGLFYHPAFVQDAVVLRVLPPVAGGQGPPPAMKRDNTLPPPGVHRLRRPGSGSELLDLRDYMPGDPPKTIAWKVSARRDRLITKEFESEAPLRCTLFVDASNSVRVPTIHGKALGRLIEIAAAVLQANADVRDLTGLCLFDEHGATILPPDRSPAHVTRVLQTLADAAALAPGTARIDPDHMIPLAYAFAREVYPQCMRPQVNGLPFWVEWLDSFPGYTRRSFTLINYLYRRKRQFYFRGTWSIPFTLLLMNLALLGCNLYGGLPPRWLLGLSMWASVVVSTVTGAGASLLLFLTLLASGRHQRLGRYRKQLAALLSVRHGLAPGGLAAMLEDDDAFALQMQRFLAEHQVPYTLPLYERSGRYLFAAPEKVPVLAAALLRAVGKGRDNELFVLLVDLLELDEALDPLLRAVRVAAGRRHQVILVIPWPTGMRPPPQEPPADALTRLPPAVAFRRATTLRFHHAYHRVRRTFARLGVQVVCAVGEEPVPLILAHLNRLRAAGRK